MHLDNKRCDYYCKLPTSTNKTRLCSVSQSLISFPTFQTFALLIFSKVDKNFRITFIFASLKKVFVLMRTAKAVAILLSLSRNLKFLRICNKHSHFRPLYTGASLGWVLYAFAPTIFEKDHIAPTVLRKIILMVRNCNGRV